MIEFGRAVMVQQVLVNASREGARQAVLDGSTLAEVQDRIDVYLSASSIEGATISVDPAPQAAGFGEPVTVTITVPFNDVSWLPVPQYIGGTTLRATSVMRRETSQ
jgi:Flp pilus assembly protein TadG